MNSSYKRVLVMMAESPLDVTGILFFLHFQIPVKVSKKMKATTVPNIPYMGAKKAIIGIRKFSTLPMSFSM